MGLFRKLRKLATDRLLQDNSVPPQPPPNDRHQWRDEAAVPNNAYEPLPRSFFNAVNSAREEAGYDPLPVFPHGHEELREEFRRGRSKSRDRSSRPGSPQHFRQQLPGTPIKFRRRPISPELLHARASSPFLFRQHSLPGSPDVMRRFQQPQMMMHQPAQFYPHFQQPFHPMMNPNLNMPPPWFMPQHPQMHPFF